MNRNSFVFYRSFFEAIEQANENEQLQLFRGIATYALDGVEPTFSGLIKAVWLTIKPQIDANTRRYLNGCKGAEHGIKGGRPSTLDVTIKNCSIVIPPSEDKGQGNITITPHCSQCRHYDYLGHGIMYCNKLQKRITARKRPCKNYSER